MAKPPHSELFTRNMRVPEITRCWQRVVNVLPKSDPSNPDDPSVNLDTLAAIANAKWWKALDLEAQLKARYTREDILAVHTRAVRAEEQYEGERTRARFLEDVVKEAEAAEQRLKEQLQTTERNREQWKRSERQGWDEYERAAQENGRLREQLETTRAALALTKCFNEEVGWGTCPDVDESAGICSRCAALGVSFPASRQDA